MSFHTTPYKSRPAPGQLGSTPFRSGSTPFRSSSTNKFRSSLVPMNKASPTRPSNSPAKSAKVQTDGRDIFSTTTTTPRHQRTMEFAPDLPAEVTRPRAGVRKYAPRKSVSGGMSNTASTELFSMRIPSPDPKLTGQAVAGEVPDDANRTDSVYADQFLAHKCPPNFDEVQRRQFFCVLDLRRLKYTADEIFAKKDWKLNIIAFAKEYERSRGKIMLHYGLYEFGDRRPSKEAIKRWKAANGIPLEPEDDHSSTPRNRRPPGPAGSVKRKAEDEPVHKDNALMTSTANHNKRRNVAENVDDTINTGPALFKKSKRKVEETEEMDENKPHKLQRSTPAKSTPSTATSLFESILNKTQNSGASPAKQSSQPSPLFSSPKPKDSKDTKFAAKATLFESNANGSLFGSVKPNSSSTTSGSVLSIGKLGSTPKTNTGNIFSYLSESSSENSANENENADGDDSGSESEHDAELPEPVVATSTDKSTPSVKNGSLFSAVGKPSSTANIFGGQSQTNGQTPKGGLFGRVQMGTDGQPIRASPIPDEKPNSFANPSPATTQQQKETPTKAGGDFTFNAATTPISFGGSIFGAPKPPTTEQSKPEVKSDIESKKPVSIFGASTQPTAAPKPNAQALFGLSGSTKPKSSEDGPVSIFASSKPGPASTSLFGASPSVFASKSTFVTDGQADDTPSATKKQASSIFGKPAASTGVSSEPKALPSTIDEKKVSDTAPTKNEVPSIFDKSFIANNAAQVKTLPESSKPSTDLFSRNSNPLFEPTKDATVDPSVSATEKQTPSIFDKSFIASNAAQVKTLAGSSKPSPDLFSRGSNPLFGTPKTNGTTSTDAKSIFSQPVQPASENLAKINGTAQTPSVSDKETKGSLFDFKASAPIPSKAPIFGTQGDASLSMSTSNLFGEKKPKESIKPAPSIFSSTPAASSSIFNFGSQPSSGSSQPASTIFSAGPTPGASISFGASNSQVNDLRSTKSGIQFGSSAPSAPSASFTFGQNSSPAPTTNTTPFAFGQNSNPAPTANSASFTFGQDSSSGSGFTFSAGTDKQPINNPFAASQPSAPVSAPIFGGNSTVTPSSTFNVSFGQEPSSTPKAAPPSQGTSLFGSSTNMNGAPSFSFTQATPSQSFDSKFSKSAAMNPFGHLNTGEGSMMANSFPAPSSIGTTPVNGTPEPQSPREDGDEAPQEQIKLTEGGPGEEDEIIVYEVRAKAIKYVPVQRGDEDQPKSPWSTKGVGPLRVLKNKSTGAVRILLRAEPRGHIAMNKTILADVEYRAKEKTVNFAAASDDGSGLETWVLQVKKPELATELASILESNKSANKK